MISKIINVFPKGNTMLNKCKATFSVKTESSFSSVKKPVSINSKLAATDKLFCKVKNIIKSAKDFFTEKVGSKSIDAKTLKEKEKFIRETNIYDPNSPDYIHANYSVGKKSK